MAYSTRIKYVQGVSVEHPGSFQYDTADGVKHIARFDLFLIRNAWERGCDFEDLADGFGAGFGTMAGDWSGIRDSSADATLNMLSRALNFLGLR